MVHCYADEAQLYGSFSPNKSTEQFEAVTAIQHCVDDIRNWMTNSRIPNDWYQATTRQGL